MPRRFNYLQQKQERVTLWTRSCFLYPPSLLFSKKNITNITFWGNGSVKHLFYSQLSMRHQGDVLGDVFSQ